MSTSRNRTPRALMAVAAAILMSVVLAVPSATADPSSDRRATVAEVERAFRDVEIVVEQVNALDVEIKQTKSEIDDLSAEIAAIEKSHSEQKEELSAAIVQQQLDAPLGPTVNLLGSRDPDTFLQGLSAMQALNNSRADALEHFATVSAQLENRLTQLEDRKAALEADKKKVAEKREEIKARYQKAKDKLAQLTLAEQQAFNSSNLELGFEVDASGRAKTAINFAMAQLGKPYIWGGTGPKGYDCSGLVMKSFAAAGISIPRVVGPQYAAGRKIPLSQLQPGDVVFYGDMSHDGIYLGNGRVIHAPRPGKVIEITGMSRFTKAARFA